MNRDLGRAEVAPYLADAYADRVSEEHDPEVFGFSAFQRMKTVYLRELEGEEGVSITGVESFASENVPLVQGSPGYYTGTEMTVADGVEEANETPGVEDMVTMDYASGWTHISLSNGEELVGYHSGPKQCLLAGRREGFHSLYRVLETASIRDLDPGVYRVARSMFDMEMVEDPNFHRGSKVFHQAKQDVLEEIDNFFGNIERFLKHGGNGTRSILLYGPPGNGKSELLRSIVDEHKDDKVTAILSRVDSASHIAGHAAHEDMPAIIAAEDVEKSFENPESELLQWMSGANQPRNENGMLFIYTTNHIDKISSKILRPGRVDDKVHFGNLDEISAMQCASYYLPDDIDFEPGDIQHLVAQETGAVINDLIQRGCNIAVSRGQKLTPGILEEALQEISDQREDMEQYEFEE